MSNYTHYYHYLEKIKMQVSKFHKDLLINIYLVHYNKVTLKFLIETY